MRWTGTDKLRAQLRSLRAAAPLALASALYEESEAFIENVKEHHVPVMDGQLRGSGFVHPPEVLGGANPGYLIRMGFGGAAAPYAWVVHENPRAGKTEGVSPSGRRYKKWAKVGHWKYFERPFLAWQKRLPGLISRRIAMIWRTKGVK